MKDILMPSFGADMAKGEVAQWKVKPGDRVKNGDIIASIETMKGLIDMEVFDDGVIESLLVAEGQELGVGQIIAKMRLSTELEVDTSKFNTPQEKAPENTALENTTPNDGKSQQLEQPITAQQAAVEKEASSSVLAKGDATYAIKHRGDGFTRPILKQGGRKKISPLALKTAQQQGLDWQQIAVGSGPDGAIVLADIMAVTQVGISQSADFENTLVTTKKSSSEKPSAADEMRKAIGAVVSQSKREIPH